MKMKRNIIIAVAVIAVLAGAYFFLTRPETPEEEKPEEPKITVFETDAANIVDMRLFNEELNIHFIRAGDVWQIAKSPEAELSPNGVTALAAIGAKVLALEEIEKQPADYSSYGLDEPAAVFTYQLSDGTQKSIAVGDAVLDGGKYYFKMGDADTVYTMGATDAGIFFAGATAFRNAVIVKTDIEALTAVDIRRPSGEMNFRMKTDAEKENAIMSWKMTAPFERDVEVNAFQTMVADKISSLPASGFVDEVDDLAPFGLDSPAYTARITSGEAQTVMHVGGAASEDSRYVKVEGQNSVFIVTNANLTFLDADPFTLIDKHLALIHIDNLAGLTITNGGEKSNFRIERLPEVDSEGAEGTTSTVYLGDKILTQDDFANFYQTILKLKFDEMAQNAPGGSPAVTMTFTQTNGLSTTSAFYSYDEMNYTVVVDGKDSFVIKKKYVDKALAELAALAAK